MHACRAHTTPGHCLPLTQNRPNSISTHPSTAIGRLSRPALHYFEGALQVARLHHTGIKIEPRPEKSIALNPWPAVPPNGVSDGGCAPQKHLLRFMDMA